MAEFKAVGLDELALSLQEIAEIPEDIQDEMLRAQGDIVAQAQRESAQRYGIQRTGTLIRSIKPGKVKLDKHGNRVLYVTPVGSRVRGGKKTTNAEIAFLNEYGTRGQRARPPRRRPISTTAGRTAADYEEVTIHGVWS